MRSDLLTTLTNMRANDMRAIILPFSIAHTGVAIILGFGGAGLEDSGVQLAIAAWVVLGSLWSAMTMDGAIADLAAGAKDMDDEMADSNIGRNYAKTPFAAIRAVSFLVVALIVIAEVIAIY